MSERKIHEGGCLCGAVRYRIAGEIESVVHCHCTMCRRTSGAAAATWITVPRDSFTVTRGAPARHKSSDHGERTFCSTCGSQLTFFSARRPNDMDITLGSLDRPEVLAAQYHIWTSARLANVHLDEHLPSHPKNSPNGTA